jgi:hypothetical protein
MRKNPSGSSFLMSNSNVVANGTKIWLVKRQVAAVITNFEMVFCVSWYVITFVLYFLTVQAVQCKLFCTICTVVLLVGTWGAANCWQLCRSVFIGKTCISLLSAFAKLVWFVKHTKVVLRNPVVCCNLWKTLANRLSMCLWTLLCSYHVVTVAMTPSLLLLTVSRVWFVLSLVSLTSALSKLLSCSLSIGCVVLVFLVRLFLIVTHVFRVLFGSPCVQPWLLGRPCLLLTTLKPMD